MSRPTHTYIVICKCGKVVASYPEIAARLDAIAYAIGQWINAGYHADYVPFDARFELCDCETALVADIAREAV